MNTIYKTLPRHTEENVLLDQVLEIYFLVDMEKVSFRQDTIILFNMTEQIVEPISFEYNRRLLKVTPVSKLKANNHYQLQLLGGEKGLKDITKRQMAQTFELEFFSKDVESLKPPIIISPTDVSVIKAKATFELKPELNADYYELQISKSNTFHNIVWPTNEQKIYRTDEVKVTPDVNYQTGLYYARVRAISTETYKSAWSEPIRFFYEGSPEIIVAEEIPMPDETPVTAPAASPVVTLQARTRVQESEELSALQGIFSGSGAIAQDSLKVKSATPSNKSVNNKLVAFNNMIASGNQKRIVIEFSENIDPDSVKPTASKVPVYVLSERN